MTESVLLARLEFFESEAKPRGELEGGRDFAPNDGLLIWGSNFEYYRYFKGTIEL